MNTTRDELLNEWKRLQRVLANEHLPQSDRDALASLCDCIQREIEIEREKGGL